MPKGAAVAALLTAAALALSGCSGSAANGEGDDRPVVLTTFTVLADIAEEVAGDRLRVESITKVGAEIHGYEPTPGDLRRAAGADLILDNGLNLEAWFAQFVEGLDVPHAVVSEGVEPIPIADGAAEGLPNPHAWMSPLNVQVYADNMAEAFADLAPEHADEFAANAEAYGAELQAVHDELVAELAALPESQRALVTCEGAFSYLARDAGLTEQYLWAVNAEQQATPKSIARTIEFVDDQGCRRSSASRRSPTRPCSRSSRRRMPHSAVSSTSTRSPSRAGRCPPTSTCCGTTSRSSPTGSRAARDDRARGIRSPRRLGR